MACFKPQQEAEDSSLIALPYKKTAHFLLSSLDFFVYAGRIAANEPLVDIRALDSAPKPGQEHLQPETTSEQEGYDYLQLQLV